MQKSISVVIPVYNEEVDLPRNIPTLYSFLKDSFKGYSWEIIIADNGPSRDRTPEVSHKLAQELSHVKYVCIPRPARGGALNEVWSNTRADYLAYMDVDLSSDLKYFPKLISALESGADIAIGSRLARGSKVYGRTLTREIMSRGYNALIKLFFWTSFRDAQCGFKAITREAAKVLLPYIKDRAWFFDSEMLIVGEKAGYRVAEVPITWRDDPNSTVKVAKTAWGDIKGLWRIFWSRPWREIKNSK